MKIFKTIGILTFAVLFFISCGEKKKEMTEEATEEATEETTEIAVSKEATEETTKVAVIEKAAPNIVEVAVGNDAFSTLTTAITLADLVEALTAEGPYTVFGPTDDAFAKLPKGTVESLFMPENKDDLIDLLTYHVVEGKFEAAAVIDAINDNDGKFTVPTIQGGSIDLSLKDGNVILTDAKGGVATVVIADVAASNGVIHAIDTVVMPE